MTQIGDVTPDQLITGASVLTEPAEKFENESSIEAMWAHKAWEHAMIYFNILSSVDPKFLKLTPHDDQIYKLFREIFPNFPVDKIDEDKLKSTSGKLKWRPFCEQFKNVVEDYNLATLLRTDCTGEYMEDNTILTTRIQFYAIELARNREGLNDGIREKYRGMHREEKTDTES